MDNFLREIHVSIFKEWILFQKKDYLDIQLNEQYPYIINIDSTYCYGEIVFQDMNIIEMNVFNKEDDEGEFYLHFQMRNMKHAVELFGEMCSVIKKLSRIKQTKIVLCCSSGLTTSFFASQIQEAASLLHLNYSVTAIGYQHLFEHGDDYDIILLAPQVHHLQLKLESIYPQKLIMCIPTQIFATYNVADLLVIMRERRIAENRKRGTSYAQISPLQSYLHNQEHILCLSIFRNQSRIHIAYRLFHPNYQIIESDEIIKRKISVDDIYDVIDTMLIKDPTIEKI